MSEKKEYVIGRNAVRELLRAHPQRVVELIAAKNLKGLDEILDLCSQNNISVRYAQKDELSNLAGTTSHQSVVASIKQRSYLSLTGLIDKARGKDRSIVLALDSVFDPQNLGTILRAAECFGVDSVIWSKNRGASITPVVTKASVGATELVDVVPVSNLSQAVSKLKKEGFWSVAADGGSSATSIREFSFPEKSVILFGSEGDGLSPLLLKNADFTVRIPMKGNIDSLNISQSVATFLYAACAPELS